MSNRKLRKRLHKLLDLYLDYGDITIEEYNEQSFLGGKPTRKLLEIRAAVPITE